MNRMRRFGNLLCLAFLAASFTQSIEAQDLPPRYATLELFTNTPCPICASQNPGLFDRLEAFEGQYHLVSFYPGSPYQSCIFYQANTSENLARKSFYPMVFGSPTVAINGVDFRNSSSVTNTVLNSITGGESWLSVTVAETTGDSRDVDITLQDHVGGSLEMGKLFAVIVEREIMYNAPNGETLHHNVFRKFLTDTSGDDIDLSSGSAEVTYQYEVDDEWNADEIYVVAWLTNTETKEVINSGTRFDPVLSGTNAIERLPLSVYPNPVSDLVHIDSPENATAPLRVFNANGQLVHEQNVTAGKVILDVSAWPVGSYHAEVKFNQRVWSGRFEVVR